MLPGGAGRNRPRRQAELRVPSGRWRHRAAHGRSLRRRSASRMSGISWRARRRECAATASRACRRRWRWRCTFKRPAKFNLPPTGRVRPRNSASRWNATPPRWRWLLRRSLSLRGWYQLSLVEDSTVGNLSSPQAGPAFDGGFRKPCRRRSLWRWALGRAHECLRRKSYASRVSDGHCGCSRQRMAVSAVIRRWKSIAEVATSRQGLGVES